MSFRLPLPSSRRVLALLGVLALLVAMAACSNSSSGSGDEGDASRSDSEGSSPGAPVPGVTDDEIRFAAFGTDSNNPLGTCNLVCFVQGVEAYFAFRNSEGGVHGRDLVVSTVLDDELANNQVKALEIIEDDDTFAAFSSAQIPSGWQDVADAGIPLYVWAIHFPEMAGNESIFGNSGVRCTHCPSPIFIQPGTELDATKVAAVGYGVSQTSKDCVTANERSFEMYGPDTGMEVVYTNDELAFGLPNGIAPEVTAMDQAGVDVVVGCIDLIGMQTLAEEMERQGMGDVPMVHSNTYDAEFVRQAGDLFEGDIIGVQFRPFEADPGDSLLDEFAEWIEETGAEPTEQAMVGWINADLAYQGLLAAGSDFDRASVIAATNEITDYTAGGLVAPIDWSRQHEPPTEDDPVTHGPAQECATYVSVHDGEMELIGDPELPWSCWDPALTDWTEPEATTFE